MKTVLFSMLTCFFYLFLISCEKGDVGLELKRETEEKIKGRWNLVQRTDYVYHPISNLVSTQATAGTANDYYVFESGGIVKINSASSSQTQEAYEVFNPNQIRLHNDVWFITELTANRFVLKKDRYDVPNDKRFVTIIEFSR